jgi:hypothetical protein
MPKKILRFLPAKNFEGRTYDLQADRGVTRAPPPRGVGGPAAVSHRPSAPKQLYRAAYACRAVADRQVGA